MPSTLSRGISFFGDVRFYGSIFLFRDIHVSRGVYLFRCVFSNEGVFSREACVNRGVTLYGNVFVIGGCSSPATYRLAGVCPCSLVVRPSLRAVAPFEAGSHVSFKG